MSELAAATLFGGSTVAVNRMLAARTRLRQFIVLRKIYSRTISVGRRYNNSLLFSMNKIGYCDRSQWTAAVWENLFVGNN